jgi:hypothetical protein
VFGKTTPFTAEKLAQLYPNHPVFAAKWAKATFESLVAGFILPADAVLVAGSGVTSNIGN